MKRILIGGLLFIIFGLGSWWVFSNRDNILSPSSDKKTLRQAQDELITFGFLPTWMVGKTRTYGKEVSHLIFLGIESDEKGNLIWDTQAKKINNQDYLAQKDKIKISGGKNILGIKLFKDEKLKKLLADEKAKDNLISQVIEVVSEGGFDGVNVDFEFQNNQTAVLGENFGGFLEKLKKSNVGEVSVDVFANTIIKGETDKLIGLLEKIDYLVVMAYDFNRPGVNYAGAVAPISSKPGDRNINEVIEKIISGSLDKNKIIMAYPLYGYEWKTETSDFESKVIRGWYQMASWNRVKSLIKDKNLVVNFDELSMSPWINFEENRVNRQIYFENEKSLKAKIDLVRQNKLRGYGFWALGYEGEDISVWNL